jgi:hypothetical protein
MATVTDRPSRAKRARKAPAPPVAAPAPPPVAVGPPVRTGRCSLWLRIGGVYYRARIIRPVPGGFVRVVTLWKCPDGPGTSGTTAYAVASDGAEIKCTCTDYSINGAQCKHIRALLAEGLIDAPAPPPVAATPVAATPINDRIPEGWQPGGAAVRPCAACDEPFAPGQSGHPKLCGNCFAEEQASGYRAAVSAEVTARRKGVRS